MQAQSLHELGALDESRQILEALIARNPDHASAHRMLARLASDTKHPARALEHMARACAIAPDCGQLRFEFACLLAHADRLTEAASHFQAATQLIPDSIEAWRLQGMVLLRLRREREALESLRHAYALAPGHNNIVKPLADLEFSIGAPESALPLLGQLLDQDPRDRDLRLKLGETHSRLGQHGQAFAVYEQGLTLAPGSAELWMALAQTSEDLGDRQAARQAYARALELKPDWALPLCGLLEVSRSDVGSETLARALRLQGSASLDDADRALLGYALGKAHDARSEYGRALDSWNDANAARRRLTGKFDRATLARLSQAKMEMGEIWAQAGSPGWGCAGANMVFIVGMPRSGTTLTDQIIATHPQAASCGELPDITLLIQQLSALLETRTPWPRSLAQLTPDMLRDPAARYLAAATRNAPATALRLIDKAPLNFHHLGPIALMFPAARIIWCRRDPRDIGISVYGENFSMDATFATDLGDIGYYIGWQERLMRYWKGALALPILELHYEDLVADIETHARRAVEFTGLPWDPACLEFHSNGRGVQTPSRWQVKEPVHTRSVGRWKNYEAALHPLLEGMQNLD